MFSGFQSFSLQISLHDIGVKPPHHVCRCEIEIHENKVMEWGMELGGMFPWHAWCCGLEPQPHKTQTAPQRWGAREKRGERRARRTGGEGRTGEGLSEASIPLLLGPVLFWLFIRWLDLAIHFLVWLSLLKKWDGSRHGGACLWSQHSEGWGRWISVVFEASLV